MSGMNVVLIVAGLAVAFWVPGLRRLTWGKLGPESRIHAHVLALIGVVAAVVWCTYAIASGARLDYEAYLIQWQMVLDGEVAPWGEHSRNAYGPLYNLLAWPAGIDPYLPKCLFVGVWVWSGVFLSALGLRRAGRSGVAYAIAAAMLIGPYFVILVGHYGYFDILPGVLCLLAVHLRMQGRDAGSGTALAAAVLLKYYPLAMLPFLMLDGRRLRWRLGVWCVGLIALGMLMSYAVWGDSTVHPLSFAADRPSKWLSVFRYLRGPYSPLALVMQEPNADALAMPVLILSGGGVWLWCWFKRIPTVPACIAGLAIGLQFYKVGHVQFQMPVVLMIMYSAAAGGLMSRGQRKCLFASVAYLVWLTGFVLVYALLRRVSRDGVLLSIRDFTGLIGLVMTCWLVLPILTIGDHRVSVEATHEGA